MRLTVDVGLWLSISHTTLGHLVLYVYHVVTTGFQAGGLLYFLKFFLKKKKKIFFCYSIESTTFKFISGTDDSFHIDISESVNY